MGSCWDESNPFPTLTKPTSTLQQVLADSAGIAAAWEVELPHQPTRLHGQAVVIQVHQAQQTCWRVLYKVLHISNQLTPQSIWFQFHLPHKGTQAQTKPQQPSHSTAYILSALLNTVAHK